MALDVDPPVAYARRMRSTSADLSHVSLRPMEATIAGYPWLPRMIDKARAARAGTLGTYCYPCPIDRTCLGLLGLDAELFADVATAAVDDADVLALLAALGIPTAAEAAFDPVALERRLHEAA
jgi:hypothetical protein